MGYEYTLDEYDQALYDAFYGGGYEFESDYWTTGFIVTPAIICSVGLIFNAVVIVLICVLKEYKKASHWYILNLAFADLFFLLLLPLNILEYSRGKWTFGHGLCVAYIAAVFINYYAASFFIAVMSFDRYLAITHPMSLMWRKFRSTRCILWLTAVVWGLAILITLPLLLRTSVKGKCQVDFYPEEDIEVAEVTKFTGNATAENLTAPPTASYITGMALNLDMTQAYIATTEEYGLSIPADIQLSYHWQPVSTAEAARVIINFILTFLLPVFIMIFCYGCILWRVLHPRVPSSRPSSFRSGRKHSSASGSSHGNCKNKRITFLVVSLVFAFIICWLPHHAVILHTIFVAPHYYGMYNEKYHNLKGAVQMLAFANSMLNPVLYTFFGVNFKYRLQKVGSGLFSGKGTKNTMTSFKYLKSKDQIIWPLQFTKVTKTSDSADPTSGSSANIKMQVVAEICHPTKSEEENGKIKSDNEEPAGIASE